MFSCRVTRDRFNNNLLKFVIGDRYFTQLQIFSNDLLESDGRLDSNLIGVHLSDLESKLEQVKKFFSFRLLN